ncbi:MAG: hypothetical protein ACKVZJ_06315 [Phycisphaerales bacterium]
MFQIPSSFHDAVRPVPSAIRGAVVALTLLLTVAWAAPARAQCPPAWVPGFGTTGMITYYDPKLPNTPVVFALASLPGGDVIVGGAFNNAGGAPASNISRYNPTTGVWTGLGGGINGSVNALAALPGGDFIVGGFFDNAGGVAVSNNIARLNPTTGVWTSLGGGTNSTVSALAVLPGGDVIAGGSFTDLGGVSANRIARYNPTTNTWSSLGSGVINTGAGGSGGIIALAVLPGGDVIAGGLFNFAGGVPARNIARYNPTTGDWSPLGLGVFTPPPFGSSVSALAVLPGGDVIAGGEFNTAGSIAASNIARYNTTTGAWTALGTGTSGYVRALLATPGGDVFVAGAFTLAGNAVVNGIARVNSATGVWTPIGSGIAGGDFSPTGYGLASLPGVAGDVILGGEFTSAGGLGANRVARFTQGANGPSIISQPLPIVTATSASAFFGVTASGGAGSGTLTYQWRKGGVAINTITNPSAATPVLSLTNVQAADLGSYDCLVTDSCGGTPSNPATLSFTVTPCVGDLTGDGVVNTADLVRFLGQFGRTCP